ncbi:MAG: hypothetical protein ACLGIK_06445 [Gemmatimonadota bacterium]
MPRDLFDTIAAIKAREGFDSKATVIRKAIVVYQRQMERAEG